MDANGEITDIKISQATNFETQMLDYAKRYGFLGK
jgi:hypothetical protein